VDGELAWLDHVHSRTRTSQVAELIQLYKEELARNAEVREPPLTGLGLLEFYPTQHPEVLLHALSLFEAAHADPDAATHQTPPPPTQPASLPPAPQARHDCVLIAPRPRAKAALRHAAGSSSRQRVARARRGGGGRPPQPNDAGGWLRARADPFRRSNPCPLRAAVRRAGEGVSGPFGHVSGGEARRGVLLGPGDGAARCPTRTGPGH
jgi:hypothetical protein